MKNKYIGLQWTQDIQALASFCGMISLEEMDFNSSPKIRQMQSKISPVLSQRGNIFKAKNQPRVKFSNEDEVNDINDRDATPEFSAVNDFSSKV